MNIFLFFYLFILFILLTPGTIITLPFAKQSPYSKWIIAAIHGFLFSAIAITTYSFVNDLYNSIISAEQDGFIDVDTGYEFVSKSGEKTFNTPSDKPPGMVQYQSSVSEPNIKCGKNLYVNGENWCGSVDPNSNHNQVFCYGDTRGCLVGIKDCNSDSDCRKYNGNSKRYSDYAHGHTNNVCKNFRDDNFWGTKFCKLFGYKTAN